MKLSLKQLKQMIRETIKKSPSSVNEATGGDGVPQLVDANSAFHLEVSNEYVVTGMPGSHVFLGWSGDADTPPEQTTLKFRDAMDQDEWEAYYSDGIFVWGSSAEPLEVQETSYYPENDQSVQQEAVGEYESPVPGASPAGPTSTGPAWLAPLKSAMVDLKYLNRMTTFSMWYKGEHGRAWSTLRRAARTALKAAKTEGNMAAVEALNAFNQAIAEKNDSQYHFDQVMKAVGGGLGESKKISIKLSELRQIIREEVAKTRSK